jgi:hypothetical protein
MTLSKNGLTLGFCSGKIGNFGLVWVSIVKIDESSPPISASSSAVYHEFHAIFPYSKSHYQMFRILVALCDFSTL